MGSVFINVRHIHSHDDVIRLKFSYKISQAEEGKRTQGISEAVPGTKHKTDVGDL
jgi:transposase